MKKIIVFLLALTLLLTNLNAVLAEEISAPPASQISPDLSYASVERTFSSSRESLSRGKPNIVYLHASIKKSSSTTITISATTESDIVSDSIGGRMAVQRWINNSWSTYATYSFWSYYASSATSKKTVSVPTNYYYRLVVTHIATNMDGMTAKQSTTSSVFIN